MRLRSMSYLDTPAPINVKLFFPTSTTQLVLTGGFFTGKIQIEKDPLDHSDSVYT